ncbi:carboxylesterase/lipase family protein [Humidisolicoccus flavus]|uniref:carboxylesterase/lipase family protein n=1 Tax=Humidisolicoccus flavus TaxID=3111414 RepID=UPI00324DCA71
MARRNAPCRSRVAGKNRQAVSVQSKVVRTSEGLVRGVASKTGLVWRGIPFAKAPVGELRFRAPQRPDSWQGVRASTRFGSVSVQRPSITLGGVPRSSVQSEDCLSMNIWTPPEAEQLPVMVWIHGGAYTQGAGSLPEYDGELLAAEGVVLVTFNYRLGALGNFDFSTLTNEHHTFESNLALRDQIAALEWVQENIAGFGGDPDNVTVFGESAGGNSVTTLLAIPRSQGLFHAAIAQSSHAASAHGAQQRATMINKFARAVKLHRDDLPAWLMSAPATAIIEAGLEVQGSVVRASPGVLAMCPTIDGDLITEPPLTTLTEGRGHAVPIIIGSTRDEANLFFALREPIMPATHDSLLQMLEDIKQRGIDEIMEHYLQYGGFAWARLATDAVFRMPSLAIAEGHAQHGAWVYRFSAASPLLSASKIGATHGADVPFVFGTLDSPGGRLATTSMLRSVREGVSATMRKLWTTFAREHSVVDAGWPEFSADHRLTLDITETLEVHDDPDRSDREIWDGLGVFD